jgi:alcohol dehydrogenase class IV
MVEINDLMKEVAAELHDEETKAAKSALKQVERDIMNAKKVVANLERKKSDLIVAIGEGSF